MDASAEGLTDDVPNPTVAVFTVCPILVVTLEGERAVTVHVNVGGQGAWVARAVVTLGGCPTLCAPFGGDTGTTARLILADGGYDVDATATTSRNGLYVEARDDDGHRHCMHDVAAEPLPPRDLDEVYQSTIRAGLAAGTCIVTGSPFADHLDTDVLRRLCLDLHAAGVITVADVSGDQLDEVLSAGVDWLKVSDDELIADGKCGRGEADLGAWLDDVVERGRVRIGAVASSDSGRTLARTPDRRIVGQAPRFEVVDTRGSGDSMCAAMALAHAREMSVEEAVRLGIAAGAANATRRSTAAPSIEAVVELERTVATTVRLLSDGGWPE